MPPAPHRMGADAARLRWTWAIAAVDAAGAVHVLDPGRARQGREVRLGAEAEVANFPQFADAHRRPAGPPR